jgi:SpoVK/Ycf46/Vps4 family AAA+-type ATPase
LKAIEDTGKAGQKSLWIVYAAGEHGPPPPFSTLNNVAVAIDPNSSEQLEPLGSSGTYRYPAVAQYAPFSRLGKSGAWLYLGYGLDGASLQAAAALLALDFAIIFFWAWNRRRRLRTFLPSKSRWRGPLLGLLLLALLPGQAFAFYYVWVIGSWGDPVSATVIKLWPSTLFLAVVLARGLVASKSILKFSPLTLRPDFRSPTPPQIAPRLTPDTSPQIPARGSIEQIPEPVTQGPPRRTAEEVLAELDGLVGLADVKAQVRRVRNRIEVAKRRQDGKVPPQSLVFAGAPGTGKTTVARIYGDLLAALGVLRAANWNEVSRVDLVGEYQGHTAPKVKAAFEKARPGVLFIDEVYALNTDQRDTLGQEAIDTIVKLMEDYRDEVAVIVAGYSERMPGFLRTNPGLKSRFTRTIVFPNYSVAELMAIFEGMVVANRLRLAEGTQAAVEKALDRLRDGPDFSNARDVRVLLQKMLDHQADRVAGKNELDADLLLPEDVVEEDLRMRTDDARLDRLVAELDAMVGLTEVKKQVRQVVATTKLNQQRKREGKSDLHVAQHLVFSGSPGTGKTTVARLYGQMLAAMGALAQGQVIEASRVDLVGEHLGETALKVRALFERAKGGVLFIDEAYGLRTDERDSFGREAVDTLVKLMEDMRSEVAVIAAGYSAEMADFLASNSGLKSRFGRTIEFENYTITELVQIFEALATQQGLSTTGPALQQLTIELEREPKGPGWGNGREMRKLLDAAVLKLAERCAIDPDADDSLLLPEDLEFERGLTRRPDAETKDRPRVDSLLRRLDAMVGLTDVKHEIRSVLATSEFNRDRVMKGLTATELVQHLIFAGAPGTGKTTVARIYGELLAASGMLARGQVVEKTRSGLVGGPGSASLVKKAFEQALGGVLFIDEAYALKANEYDGVGQEAVEALLQLMEDHRDEVVVIAAGYTDKMQEFLGANAGLRSRFSQTVVFPNYAPEELVAIFKDLAGQEQYYLADKCQELLVEHFQRAVAEPGFGNARSVRNLLQASIRNLARRRQLDSHADLTILEAQDLAVTGVSR